MKTVAIFRDGIGQLRFLKFVNLMCLNKINWNLATLVNQNDFDEQDEFFKILWNTEYLLQMFDVTSPSVQFRSVFKANMSGSSTDFVTGRNHFLQTGKVPIFFRFSFSTIF